MSIENKFSDFVRGRPIVVFEDMTPESMNDLMREVFIAGFQSAFEQEPAAWACDYRDRIDGEWARHVRLKPVVESSSNSQWVRNAVPLYPLVATPHTPTGE